MLTVSLVIELITAATIGTVGGYSAMKSTQEALGYQKRGKKQKVQVDKSEARKRAHDAI